MKKRWIALLLVFLMLSAFAAKAEGYMPAVGNTDNFSQLLSRLFSAYTSPAEDDAEVIAALLEEIRAVEEADYEVASSVVSEWEETYLNPEYVLHISIGDEYAPELQGTALEDCHKHAFVVLGYALEDGEMKDELIGRCDTAAAAARTFPDAIIVCSGGATGQNNPLGRTEAGLMKEYLVEECAIDPDRIFIDESAMTTAENAWNSLAILREQGVETITIITSAYHMLRGMALYNAVSALYDLEYGYSVRIVENYCFDIQADAETKQREASFAVMQLGGILNPSASGKQPKPGRP
ncbi:MAG: YdcF family protein [Clostridia bacterium]|nr:YdcF family protein [Clostridia bacterium]